MLLLLRRRKKNLRKKRAHPRKRQWPDSEHSSAELERVS
jgi:hypothetical protein